jgi:hypothetical protein
MCGVSKHEAAVPEPPASFETRFALPKMRAKR